MTITLPALLADLDNPHIRKTKVQVADYLSPEVPVDDSQYSDDDSFYSANSQEDEICGDPFSPCDHFMDVECYQGTETLLPTLDKRKSYPGSYDWIDQIARLTRHVTADTSYPRKIRSISSFERRNVASMKHTISYNSNMVTSPGVGTNEMDSHANTCRLGKKYIPLYYTGEVCTVHAYSDTIEPLRDIQIGASATLWTDQKSGALYILETHQALMFTDTLTDSLLNPNQIRYDRHSLCDDPWDRHCSLGISYQDFALFIPFETEGTVIAFNSRAPTADKLHTLPHLILTTDAVWDPKTVELQPLSTRDKEHESIVAGIQTSRRISSAIASNNLQPHTPLLPSGALTSDIVLASISSAFCDETLIHWLCSSIRIASEERNISVLTDKRHSTVNAEHLSRLWSIGIDAANNTLRTTPQVGVRHAVRPLSRGYRTDTQLLHYCRLNTTFYSDTLFAKVQSLKGNTCSQVFVAENCVRVHPMPTKADAGRSLRVFAEDAGVPNHIVVDSAKEQTGPNSAFMQTVRQPVGMMGGQLAGELITLSSTPACTTFVCRMVHLGN